jgi:uncharacterized protein (DUF2147 family)
MLTKLVNFSPLNKRYFSLPLLMLAFGLRAFAQADPIEHTWYNQEKTSKIKIYKAVDGKYYGKIVWLKEPLRDGKPKTDYLNSDKSKQNTLLMGLVVLTGIKKESGNEYDDGDIYDPKNGKTYSCKITFEGNHLNLRGYIGFSLFGRTAVWERAD